MSELSSPRTTDDSIDILLVEDNPGDVRLLQEAAKETANIPSLQPIPTGEEALELLTKEAEADAPLLPDLVLLDLNLPRMHGCEILKEIRNNGQLKTLPILILTSSEAPDDIQRCYNADANAYLTKPDNLDGFVSLLKTVGEFWFNHTHLPPIPQ